MKYAIISFSAFGEALAQKIKDALLREADISVSAASKFKGADEPLEASLGEWTKSEFETSDVLIYIGASGIAVRAIAPYVVHKAKDPAVLVIDDCGRHVISLLSGHLGGANREAEKIAELIGAEPVITTATDNHGLLSPDVFAKANGLQIADLKSAKYLASALLSGEKVGLISELPLEESAQLPEEVIWLSEGDDAGAFRTGILISSKKYDREELPFEMTMQLIPKNVWLGMGCRKDCAYENVQELARKALELTKTDPRAVRGIASIDLKKDEKGFLRLAEENGWEFVTYTAEELKQAPGDFKGSEFVSSITGVDNVCERAAVLASNEGRLIMGKMKGNAATAAICTEKRSINV